MTLCLLLSLTTFGGLSDDFESVIKRIACQAADRCGSPRSVMSARFRQSISFAVAKFTANMFWNCY